MTIRTENFRGSQLGCWLVPLLLIAIAVGGGLAYRYLGSPERAVTAAHQKWDSNDTQQRIAAIKEYQLLLQKKDPLDPARFWVRDDRDTLYRRIIVHEFKFESNPSRAREWIIAAWDEGIRDLRFQEPDVKEFWTDSIEQEKKKSLIENKNKDPK